MFVAGSTNSSACQSNAYSLFSFVVSVTGISTKALFYFKKLWSKHLYHNAWWK